MSTMTEPIDLTVEVDGIEVPFCVHAEHDEDPINRVLRDAHHVTPEPSFTLTRALVPDDGLLLDVGAHLGLVSLPVAARGGRVIAVEASEWRAQLLRRAADRLRSTRFEVIHGAASEEGGEWAELQGMVVVEAGGEERVQRMTLDDMLQRRGNPHVDVLKIDVEGDEVGVLRGATKLLNRERPPAVVLEANALALDRHEYNVPALLKTLEIAGYELARIERHDARRLVRTTADSLHPEAIVDYVAMRPPLVLPEGWRMIESREDDDVERLLASCLSLHPPYREYVIDVIRLAPDRIRAHRAVRCALGALCRDPDDDVRAKAQKLAADLEGIPT